MLKSGATMYKKLRDPRPAFPHPTLCSSPSTFFAVFPSSPLTMTTVASGKENRSPQKAVEDVREKSEQTAPSKVLSLKRTASQAMLDSGEPRRSKRGVAKPEFGHQVLEEHEKKEAIARKAAREEKRVVKELKRAELFLEFPEATWLKPLLPSVAPDKSEPVPKDDACDAESNSSTQKSVVLYSSFQCFCAECLGRNDFLSVPKFFSDESDDEEDENED
ncbi:hypothetical protein NMY22_g3138 [Coprinellus aureogranulatus]|nr:hypothetical protein NMY22_g3138 [Coprinellus aureogranulatus]